MYKDGKGGYKTYLPIKETNEDGEEVSIFYSKKVRFKKDIKPKHKTKIKINNGFISPYRFLTTDEAGEEKYIYGDSLFVLDFEILEEGTDEEPQPREYKKKENNDDEFNFSFGENDDLPF